MSLSTEPATPITFERFWKWMQEHANCIIRAASVDAVIFDIEEFHWDFFEDDEGTPIVQVIRGKTMVGEIAIDRSEIVFVQASIDPEEAQRGFWLFELIGGPKEESIPLYHFVVSHGMDHQGSHQELKH